jgi:cobyrinic acid a,c-diamide synthase
VFSKGYVVAGPSSGVGKTTVTLGLMAALKRRGKVVQPFKGGPDFIDPGHHTRVCGRPSRNLDGWMLPVDRVRTLFHHHAGTADISIVEGVMGLFDGSGQAAGAGSTAEIARLLGLPIVLVVDASAMAASVAALVHGFSTFDPTIRVAGVIFNRVGSANHYRLLREAMAQVAGVSVLGYLPRDPALQMPERYLGLVTAGEEALSDHAVEHLAEIVERHIEVDRVIDLASGMSVEVSPPAAPDARPARPVVRIGVARDRAFSFYYEDNFDALRAAGAEIVPFSPLDDTELPAPLDALYIGGGYPELSAEALSANGGMRAAVARFIDGGGAVYAECGGLMYLSTAIRTLDGRTWSMAGALPLTVEMTERSQRFGYVEIELTRDSLLGPAGTTARGHSFHYSRIIDESGSDAAPLLRAYRARYTLSGREEAEGFTIGRVLAS